MAGSEHTRQRTCRAREYVAEAAERGISIGRNPSGVAAACLYTAGRDLGADLTQRDAADVAGVTPVTLRSTYQELRADDE